MKLIMFNNGKKKNRVKMDNEILIKSFSPCLAFVQAGIIVMKNEVSLNFIIYS